MTPLPAEYSFDNREWNRLLAFLAGLWCVGGFFAAVIGGHSWRYTLSAAVALPVIFTLLLSLAGWRSTHRSYVITCDGVILRRHGREIERISWADIVDICPWPLTIVTRSERKIPFHLMRLEMQQARETLLDAFKDHAENRYGRLPLKRLSDGTVTPMQALIASAIVFAAGLWPMLTLHFGRPASWFGEFMWLGCATLSVVAAPSMCFITLLDLARRRRDARTVCAFVLSLAGFAAISAFIYLLIHQYDRAP